MTTQQAAETVRGLRAAMDGPVLTPADAGFDDRRKVWNALIDRRPSVIARCASAGDVAAAVGFARDHDLEVSVRAGAHAPSGSAVCDDGLMIDLSLMNDVIVDQPSRRAWAGGGALLADLDAATQAHGLAVPGGLVSHTGVGGLTLGGGMGWLTREHGLSIDNLASADVVTADGRLLRAAADEQADLFWAIRGGGGNFGVITSFEFDLHELGEPVQFAMFFWGLDRGPEALRLARDVTTALPPGVNAIIGAVNAPPAPFVPPEHQLAPGYVLLVAGFGAGREHAELVHAIRATLPPTFDLVAPMPYVELQRLLDEANAWGLYGYDKGVYLESLSDQVIDTILDQVPRKNSPMSALMLYRLDGAYSRVADDATAFSGGRSPRYAAFIIGLAPDAPLLAADRAWVRDFWAALRPYALADGNSYTNSTTEQSGEQIRGSYGDAKYERLAAIKSEYDPDNVFHLNANIRPAQSSRPGR
jgi:FAD/FMN-containing dehydrogenase